MDQAREVTELDQLCGLGIMLFQFGKGFIECQQVAGAFRGRHIDLIEIDALTAPAPFPGRLVPCPLDKDAAHRFGGSSEEVAAALPIFGPLLARRSDESQIRLVDKSGGVESLPRLLMSEL